MEGLVRMMMIMTVIQGNECTGRRGRGVGAIIKA
jgi:hypothetical protein